MKESIITFIWITIGAILLFIGKALVENYSKSDLEMHYRLKYNAVNNIGYVDFKITNNTEFAFDSLRIFPEYKDIIVVSYESDKRNNLEKDKFFWESPILPNENVNGLVVLNTQNVDLSTFIKNISVIRKNPKTHNWEKINLANIEEKSYQLFKKEWFLYFAPFMTLGFFMGLFYLVRYVYKKRKKGKT
jgi:hypothetical protein